MARGSAVRSVPERGFGLSFKHSGARYISPQMKGRYHFSPEEKGSWYVGAGMGVGNGSTHRTSDRPSDSVTGFAISGAFGYKAYQKGAMALIFEFEHSMTMQESQWNSDSHVV